MFSIGCFALVEPFTDMAHQFQVIRGMGIDHADLTDSHDGASLGVEFGFAASVSLDSHPIAIQQMAGEFDITLSSVCAHANLLDPPAPDVYATQQIIKAVQLAHFLGITQVITTEGDPKTTFGKTLTPTQRLFAIHERLYHPIQWAKSLGVQLLLEPHGIVTDDLDATAQLLEMLGEPQTVGLNLDTGNLWLGGSDPMAYIERFASRIKHVHWKDMPETWMDKRGSLHGCGMATIALGDGVIGIPYIVRALQHNGFDGPTTLEIAGKDALQLSVSRLRTWWK